MVCDIADLKLKWMVHFNASTVLVFREKNLLNYPMELNLQKSTLTSTMTMVQHVLHIPQLLTNPSSVAYQSIHNNYIILLYSYLYIAAYIRKGT